MTILAVDFLLICLAGGVGSMLRASLAAGLARNLDAASAIFVINGVGSFLIGVALGLAFGPDLTMPPPHPVPFAFSLFAIGLLGGFTTVSTFALQMLELWRNTQPARAAGLTAGSMLLCPALAFLGLVATLIVTGAS